MKKIIQLTLILSTLATPAYADSDRQNLGKELGIVSPDGAEIHVEGWKCTVTNGQNIECQNIGPICVASRAKQEKLDKYYSGCALDEWKKSHPKEICPENPYWAPSYCWTHTFN